MPGGAAPQGSRARRRHSLWRLFFAARRTTGEQRDVILTMIDGEPVVVCWQPRDFEVVLAAAADMGLPVAVSSKRPGYYPGGQELREGCCRPVDPGIPILHGG